MFKDQNACMMYVVRFMLSSLYYFHNLLHGIESGVSKDNDVTDTLNESNNNNDSDTSCNAKQSSNSATSCSTASSYLPSHSETAEPVTCLSVGRSTFLRENIPFG